MAGQLRHMLRDDDINHAEQKQILELGMKFRENRFYRQPFAGPQPSPCCSTSPPPAPVPASPSAWRNSAGIRWSSTSPVPSWPRRAGRRHCASAHQHGLQHRLAHVRSGPRRRDGEIRHLPGRPTR